MVLRSASPWGAYPEVSLQEARDKHADARKLLAKDIDPSLARKKQKADSLESAGNTFKKIALEWCEHNSEIWSSNHARTVMRRMENDIFPKIGNFPIRDINAPILLECLRQIEKRGANEVARRALQYCGGVFRYAIVTGRGDRDISADLRKGALKPFKRGHFAAMDIKALPEFIDALNKNKARMVNPHFRVHRLSESFRYRVA
jgi:integrase